MVSLMSLAGASSAPHKVSSFAELYAAFADPSVVDIDIVVEHLLITTTLELVNGTKRISNSCGIKQCVLDGQKPNGLQTQLFIANAGTSISFDSVVLKNGIAQFGTGIVPIAGGGAVAINPGANGSFRNVDFVNNSCHNDVYGGAVVVFGGKVGATATFDGCTFFNNSAQNGEDAFGGAAAVGYGAVGHFTNCQFKSNFAMSGAGASIGDGGVATFTDTLFQDNEAMGSPSGAGLGGGGLRIYAGNVTCLRCRFEHNGGTAGTKWGGFSWTSPGAAVWAQYPGDMLFKDSSFIENGAIGSLNSYNGGAVAIDQNVPSAAGSANFDNCTFVGNTANQGGAVTTTCDSLFAASPVRFSQCTFVKNNGSGQGGAIAGDNFVVENCSFEGNIGSTWRSVHCTSQGGLDSDGTWSSVCPTWKELVLPNMTLNNGVKMPAFSLGTWEYNSSLAETVVTAALIQGLNHIDTALDYGNQEGVGKALSEALDEDGKPLKRDAYFLTSKVPPVQNASAYSLTQTLLKKDLSLLNVSYVDLMLLHGPPKECSAIQAQWKALEEFYKAGFAKAIGVSNFCLSSFKCINQTATVVPAVNQIQFHVGMGPDPLELISYGHAHGIVSQAYSPLGNGKSELINGTLVTGIGGAHGRSGPQVALRWIYEKNVAFTTKTTKRAHMRDDMNVFGFKLTPDDTARLDKATKPAGKPSWACTSADSTIVV